jgi:hypothetical protein
LAFWHLAHHLVFYLEVTAGTARWHSGTLLGLLRVPWSRTRLVVAPSRGVCVCRERNAIHRQQGEGCQRPPRRLAGSLSGPPASPGPGGLPSVPRGTLSPVMRCGPFVLLDQDRSAAGATGAWLAAGLSAMANDRSVIDNLWSIGSWLSTRIASHEEPYRQQWGFFDFAGGANCSFFGVRRASQLRIFLCDERKEGKRRCLPHSKKGGPAPLLLSGRS